MNFFTGGSKKKTEKKPAPVPVAEQAANTIAEIRTNIEMLEKRKKYLDVQVNQVNEEIKQKVRNKDKKGATMLLKRKKMYEAQADQIDNQTLALEQQCMNLEQTQTNILAVTSMERGVKVTKQIHAEVGADKLEDIIDAIAEQQDLSNEMADLFASNAQQIAGGDADIDAELENLEAELLEEDLLKSSAPPTTVPATAAVVAPTQLPANDDKAAKEELERKQMEELRAQLDFA